MGLLSTCLYAALAAALVAGQVGYGIADGAAKAGYGWMIYAIARAKSKAEGWSVEQPLQTAPAVGS